MVKTPIKVAELTDFLPFLYFVADFHCHANPANFWDRIANPCSPRFPHHKRRP
jgi:hypothetical protein